MLPETHLWRAVILEALWTACGEDTTGSRNGGSFKTAGTLSDAKSRRHKEAKERRDARKWLLGKTQDFTTVCHFAGWDPEYIRERVRGLADIGWPRFVEARPDFAAICAENDNDIDLEEVA